MTLLFAVLANLLDAYVSKLAALLFHGSNALLLSFGAAVPSLEG